MINQKIFLILILTSFTILICLIIYFAFFYNKCQNDHLEKDIKSIEEKNMKLQIENDHLEKKYIKLTKELNKQNELTEQTKFFIEKFALETDSCRLSQAIKNGTGLSPEDSSLLVKYLLYYGDGKTDFDDGEIESVSKMQSITFDWNKFYDNEYSEIIDGKNTLGRDDNWLYQNPICSETKKVIKKNSGYNCTDISKETQDDISRYSFASNICQLSAALKKATNNLSMRESAIALRCILFYSNSSMINKSNDDDDERLAKYKNTIEFLKNKYELKNFEFNMENFISGDDNTSDQKSRNDNWTITEPNCIDVGSIYELNKEMQL